MKTTEHGQALSGVRVLDFTRVLAGPFASMILADLGADVIKIELPETGDEARGFGPFLNGESAYFLSVNRGKKSVTLDLRLEEGQRLARQLVSDCDILVENFRPGSMARFGLDYESVRALNPKLVYASISGFGQTGPYAQRPAYDVIIQAMSGLASITGRHGEPPVRVGSSISDLGAALYGVIGILAALSQARATGKGQQVDVAMLDCQVALLENAIARFDVTGEIPGYVVVAAGNDSLWQRLCETIGVADLSKDARFSTNAFRTENHAELEPLLAAAFGAQAVEEWCTRLGEAGVPCGPIQNIEQVVGDPQLAARQMIVRVPHEAAGELAMPASPIKFSEVQAKAPAPAPTLGQHTEEILAELAGVDRDELLRLREAGVV
jgi:CoA:oxalate CoA-transferase